MPNTEKLVTDPQPTSAKPLAWKYMLGDGKWRFQKEWSNGANMHPVYEVTPEIIAALETKD